VAARHQYGHDDRDVLMVFLIQNTHSRRDSARTGLVRLEELTDDQLKELEGSFKAFRHKVLPGKNKTLDQH
jgi:hypothetical protein